MSLALEQALLPTPKDSPAAKILMKMGWRYGHGIGPRLTWRQKRLQDAQAKSSRILTLDDLKLDSNEEDEEAQKHTYPRADTPLSVVPRKDNTHGLGYTAGLSLNDALDTHHGSGPPGPRISGMLPCRPRFIDAHIESSWLWFGRLERCRRGRYRHLRFQTLLTAEPNGIRGWRRKLSPPLNQSKRRSRTSDEHIQGESSRFRPRP